MKALPECYVITGLHDSFILGRVVKSYIESSNKEEKTLSKIETYIEESGGFNAILPHLPDDFVSDFQKERVDHLLKTAFRAEKKYDATLCGKISLFFRKIHSLLGFAHPHEQFFRNRAAYLNEGITPEFISPSTGRHCGKGPAVSADFCNYDLPKEDY